MHRTRKAFCGWAVLLIGFQSKFENMTFAKSRGNTEGHCFSHSSWRLSMGGGWEYFYRSVHPLTSFRSSSSSPPLQSAAKQVSSGESQPKSIRLRRVIVRFLHQDRGSCQRTFLLDWNRCHGRREKRCVRLFSAFCVDVWIRMIRSCSMIRQWGRSKEGRSRIDWKQQVSSTPLLSSEEHEIETMTRKKESRGGKRGHRAKSKYQRNTTASIWCFFILIIDRSKKRLRLDTPNYLNLTTLPEFFFPIPPEIEIAHDIFRSLQHVSDVFASANRLAELFSFFPFSGLPTVMRCGPFTPLLKDKSCSPSRFVPIGIASNERIFLHFLLCEIRPTKKEKNVKMFDRTSATSLSSKIDAKTPIIADDATLFVRLVLLASTRHDRLFHCEIFPRIGSSWPNWGSVIRLVFFLLPCFSFLFLSLSRFSLRAQSRRRKFLLRLLLHRRCSVLRAGLFFLLLRISLSTSHFHKVEMPFCRLGESRESNMTDERMKERAREMNYSPLHFLFFCSAKDGVLSFLLSFSLSFALVSHFFLLFLSFFFRFVLENRITLSY